MKGEEDAVSWKPGDPSERDATVIAHLQVIGPGSAARKWRPGAEATPRAPSRSAAAWIEHADLERHLLGWRGLLVGPGDPDEPCGAAAAAPCEAGPANLVPALWTRGAGPRIDDMTCGGGGPPGLENWSQAVGPEVRPPHWGKKWKRTSWPCPLRCDNRRLKGSTHGVWRARESAIVPIRAIEASGETGPLRR
ncbi:hypothetical protein NDU88_005078 [Pleurodeles waltl]|uniref:Uncharacterized protein n=1 Tax=Pleurodeles waltl TaxID=8319 RepID=A0AAV7QGT2_PLEWA|nr:hypothetical protein NDU88_005078 [Pleurodeles waltl]